MTTTHRSTTSASYTTTLALEAPPEAVLAAAGDPGAWWSTTVRGAAREVGDEFTYRFRDLHECRIRVVESTPASLVWRVEENHFGFLGEGGDQEEWVGTEIRFDVSATDRGTELRFTHDGLLPEHDCYQVCSPAWTHFVRESLRLLVETGRGLPNDGEVEPRADGFHTTFRVAASPAQVFAAVLDPRGWWSTAIEGETTTVGAEFVFHVPGVHWSRIRVLEVTPERRVVWEVEDARIEYVADTGEWVGTRVVFDVQPDGDGSLVGFTHHGLVEDLECYDACSRTWQDLMVGSLRALVETGSGTPFVA